MFSGFLVDNIAYGFTNLLMKSIQYCAGLTFLGLLFMPAYERAMDEAIVVTPALEISSLWREAALPVGIALMALYSLLRLFRMPKHTQSAQAAVFMVVVVLAIYKCQFIFEDLGSWNLLIFFVGVVLSAVYFWLDST